MHTISDKPISTREELIDHLNIAAELEHVVLVQYLFAAFSMQKNFHEGLKPHQEFLVKSWETKILQVGDLPDGVAPPSPPPDLKSPMIRIWPLGK
jgi:hypothetical protein